VMVISLDANDVSNEYVANNGYSGGAQTTWLASQLASARSRSDIDFIVAYFHHCAYCTCAVHGSEGGVRANWTALFDQYSVDLVINGHNHIYERTDPIKAGAGTTIAPIGSTIHPATEGTTYVTAGGAGKSLYNFSAPDSYEGAVDNDSAVASFINEPGGTTTPETVAWSRVRYTGYCLLVVESVPAWRGGTSRLHVRGLAEDGTELDRFTLARKAG
jgi:3',5'-cyclic AMP phosphodiesterase CpdA